MYATQTQAAVHAGVKMRGVVWLKCATRLKQPFPFKEPVMGCDLSINVWKEELFEVEYTKGSREQTLNDIIVIAYMHLKKEYGQRNLRLLAYWERFENPINLPFGWIDRPNN